MSEARYLREISTWSTEFYLVWSRINSSSGPDVPRGARPLTTFVLTAPRLLHFRKQRFRTPSQPDRLARQIESLQVRSDAAGVALVNDQAEQMEDCRQPFSKLLRRMRRNGTPEILVINFEQLIGCTIVASGTRNAFAISSVVKPPTALNVKDEVRAGWQHINNRMSAPSGSMSESKSTSGRHDLYFRRRCGSPLAAGNFATH